MARLHTEILQRSVWVLPRDIGSDLAPQFENAGAVAPRCFCRFIGEVCGCSNEQIVAEGWPWERIAVSQSTYLKAVRGSHAAARQAKSIAELMRVMRKDAQGHAAAFSDDPFLPRVLWPQGYLGEAVEKEHQRFRAVAGQQAKRLV